MRTHGRRFNSFVLAVTMCANTLVSSVYAKEIDESVLETEAVVETQVNDKVVENQEVKISEAETVNAETLHTEENENDQTDGDTNFGADTIEIEDETDTSDSDEEMQDSLSDEAAEINLENNETESGEEETEIEQMSESQFAMQANALFDEIKITSQPINYIGQSGDKATFTIVAEGSGLSYQWQLSDDGVNWRNSSTKAKTYAAILTEANNGRQVRCIVTDSERNSVTSEAAMMKIEAELGIVSQPEDYIGQSGDRATFTVVAEGSGLSYQWQLSDDGVNWRNSSTKAKTYAAILTEANNGRQVRCIVTDSERNSVTSEAASMMIKEELAILCQPEDYIGSEGSAAEFSVIAKGNKLTYLWEVSTDNGITWSQTGSEEASISVIVSDETNRNLYRCTVSDSFNDSIVSDTALLKREGIIIAVQPEDYFGLVGDTVTFKIEAEGNELTYLWQLSDNEGVNWRNSSGTTASYSVILSEKNNGRMVRCVITDNENNVVISESAVMKIDSNFTGGFSTRNGRTTYRYADGTYATGLTIIDEELYYFSSKGVMQTGYFKIDGSRYYFDDNTGVAITGLKTIINTGYTYYFRGEGGAATGFISLDDGLRYFNEECVMLTGLRIIDGKYYWLDSITGLAKEGFYTDNYNNCYYFDGANGALTGFQEIGKETYYFNSDYIMARGLANINGLRYYFDPETGVKGEGGLINIGLGALMYLYSEGGCATGLMEIEGKLYDFDAVNGSAVSGLQVVGIDTYYFSPDSFTAQTGFITLEGQTMYFGSDYKMVTGLQNIDGKLYYFSEKGYLYTGALKGTDATYYFDDNTGAAVSGWYTTISNYRFYFDSETKQAVTGWQTIDGVKYYFEDNGYQKTGLVRDDINAYYFDENGAAVTGWAAQNGNNYYFDTETRRAVTGLQSIDGTLYYFDDLGAMRTGMKVIDGKTYYFNCDTGAAQTGFITHATGDVSYFDPQTHTMVTGLQTIDGALYYFSENGLMKTGYRLINDACYYFDVKSGKARTGFIQSEEGGEVYTFYADPETYRLATGIVGIDGDLYGFKASGIMRKGLYEDTSGVYYFDEVTGKARYGFVVVNGNVSYFDENGLRVSGLQKIDNNIYSFTSGGNRQGNGIVTVDSVRYYLDGNTGISMGGVLLNPSNGNYYAFNKDGGFKTGLFDEWGTEYYAGSTGVLMVSSTTAVDGLRYYFDENGERQMGMLTYTNSTGASYTFYFGASENVTKASDIAAIQAELDSALAKDGWYEIGGLKYYVKDGKFAKGIETINGKKYAFSSLNGTLLTGMRKVNDNSYYMDEDGCVQTGFVTVNGETRYFDSSTGAMATGLVTIEGKKYYFLSNGVLATGALCIDNALYKADLLTGKLSTDTELYDNQGIKRQNCWMSSEEDLYYLDGSGTRVIGEQTINGVRYYFNAEGIMQRGIFSVGDNIRYYKESGLQTGWQRIGNDTYYFDIQTGAMLTGIQTIDGVAYYFSDEGKNEYGFVKNRVGKTYYFADTGLLTGWQTLNGKNYYFDEQGIMQTGSLTLDENIYYFGTEGVQQFGLLSYGGNTYYFDIETGIRQSGLIEIDGSYHYFNEATGRQITGRQEINGKTYYFDPVSGKRVTGFVTTKGSTFYYDDSEVGYATGLVHLGEDTYYFNESDGSIRTGYQVIDDIKYYFDINSGASVSGIYQVTDNISYYFLESGGIGYGLQTIGDKNYFFYPTNGRKITGLQSIGDTLYYFDPDEGMLKNTTVSVGDLSFVLDENGAATVKGASDLAKIVSLGMTYLGQTYKTESDGGDVLSCSGFIKVILQAADIELDGSSYHQYYMASHNPDYEIVDSIEDAMPGDIIFYTSLNCDQGDECGFWNEIHHVALYLGNGKVLHSTTHKNALHPELDCVQIEDSVENDAYFIYSIVRVLAG